VINEYNTLGEMCWD